MSRISKRGKRMFLFVGLLAFFAGMLGIALVVLDELFNVAQSGGKTYDWPNPNLLQLGGQYWVPLSIWASWEIVFLWIGLAFIGALLSGGLVFWSARRAGAR
ncbi:MAG: hypothetical protein ACYCQJ_12990 [Nitrososphaerales archaeon]